jgi:hypothetical protein
MFGKWAVKGDDWFWARVFGKVFGIGSSLGFRLGSLRAKEALRLLELRA